MKKFNVFVFIIVFLAISLTGCSSFVTSSASSSSYSGSTALPVPIITLEYGGKSTSSNDSFYTLNVGSDSSSSTGSQPGQPVSILQAPIGTDVEIVVSFSTAPATLWVVELDEKGVPRASHTFTPVSFRTSYKLTNLGKYKLQVFAEWDKNNYIRSIFDIETH